MLFHIDDTFAPKTVDATDGVARLYNPVAGQAKSNPVTSVDRSAEYFDYFGTLEIQEFVIVTCVYLLADLVSYFSGFWFFFGMMDVVYHTMTMCDILRNQDCCHELDVPPHPYSESLRRFSLFSYLIRVLDGYFLLFNTDGDDVTDFRHIQQACVNRSTLDSFNSADLPTQSLLRLGVDSH